MSENTTPPKLTFAEFKEMCEEAGFVSTPEEMETDYYIGNAITDVTEALHVLIETTPPPGTIQDSLSSIDVAVNAFDSAIDEGVDSNEQRERLVQLLAIGLRTLAYSYRDDGVES